MTLIVAQDTHHQLSGLVIERTAREMKLAFSRILLAEVGNDLTVDQWAVLHSLYNKGILSQIALGLECAKDAPTITRILDLLAQKSYIERLTDPEDRRKFLISITEEGIEKVEMILPLLSDFRAQAYQGLDTEELLYLEKTLNKIYRNIRNFQSES
jgi:DNA-binding MarR family transcriptional regulator